MRYSQAPSQRGADVRVVERVNGVTPLHIAAARGHFDAVKLLLDKGADINAIGEHEGETPLFMAVQEGHYEAVKLFLDKGANLCLGRFDGFLPLQVLGERTDVQR